MSLRTPLTLVLALLLVALPLVPASGVLIDSLDGGANTKPPVDDPGFAHVGQQGLLSSVYLGDGWVITAHHAPVEGATSTFRGVAYRPLLETRQRIHDADGRPTDLQVFRLATRPELPPLAIRPVPPEVGAPVVMIGNGADRGAERRDLFPPRHVRDGWEWIPETNSVRWGTNLVSSMGLEVAMGGSVVRYFATHFDRGLPTPHEAQATPGDSGGGVFMRRDGRWELAGIMFATDTPQPPYQDIAVLSTPPRHRIRTLCVDLSHYRDAILEAIGRLPADAASER